MVFLVIWRFPEMGVPMGAPSHPFLDGTMTYVSTIQFLGGPFMESPSQKISPCFSVHPHPQPCRAPPRSAPANFPRGYCGCGSATVTAVLCTEVVSLGASTALLKVPPGEQRHLTMEEVRGLRFTTEMVVWNNLESEKNREKR